MLENYIIDRIRKEKQEQEDRRLPLHIRVPGDYGMEQAPPPRVQESESTTESETDWGAVVVDFTI